MSNNKQMKIILASKSQARKTLLTNAGIGFEAIAADIDEDIIKNNNASLGIIPAQTAQDLADAKAKVVSLQNRTLLVLGSDQICHMDGEIFNKPAKKDRLFGHLQKLNGKTHTLTSAISIALDGEVIFRFEDAAHLTMYNLTAEEIDTYIQNASADVIYAAGGYHIESIGVQLFQKIEGSYFTIMGLPILAVIDFLRNYEK
ncbi:MAG: Maf family protein [Hyphomicrobiales bacterium]